jgi:4-hydroxy-tetrahydrodipicolinate reductase
VHRVNGVAQAGESDVPEQAPLRVAVAGVTGWTGAAVARAIADADDLTLCAGVSRSHAGQPLAGVITGAQPGALVYGSVADMLARDAIDVMVDYTSADAVLSNVTWAVEAGVHAVIGSSGLTTEGYADLDRRARVSGVGVIAAGNFSLLAALLARAAVEIAALVPDREIIDYGSASKMDAPSGTARDLAERLQARSSARPGGGDVGLIEARGADVAGTQIHSVRLPGYALSTEIVFGAFGERLSLRHDPGDTPDPYVAGTLLAVRKVCATRGVVRGIDSWLSPVPRTD